MKKSVLTAVTLAFFVSACDDGLKTFRTVCGLFDVLVTEGVLGKITSSLAGEGSDAEKVCQAVTGKTGGANSDGSTPTFAFGIQDVTLPNGDVVKVNIVPSSS